MNFWIVTACDSNAYDKMLIPFIASARDVAGWKGKIAVVDLGLSNLQIKKLQTLGVEIFRRANKSKAIVCDRFFSLYDEMNNTDLYAFFDADIWFSDNIDELFDNYDNKLNCTIDCQYQDFITGVIQNKEIRYDYDRLIKTKVLIKHDNKPLQVGFTFGNKKSFDGFCLTLDYLIRSGDASDAYGTDTLAINVFYAKKSELITVRNIAYNCLPDWSPQKIDGKIVARGISVKAIHLTSPHRSIGTWSFNSNHPIVYLKWKNILSANDDLIENVTVKGHTYLTRKGTWDHTILHHTKDYAISKTLCFPKDGCIIDIGGHIGGFTKLVGSYYPNITIHTFEPDIDSFALLKENTKNLNNVQIHNCGVGAFDSNGKIEIPSPGNTGMNRVVIGDGNINIISPETFFKIIGNCTIVFMKIDCEGGEWGFFDKLTIEQQEKIWEIQGELHTDLYDRYEPFKSYPPYNLNFLKNLLNKQLSSFSIFLDGPGLMHAHNKDHIL